jgi:hypothetical protein
MFSFADVKIVKKGGKSNSIYWGFWGCFGTSEIPDILPIDQKA